MSSKVTVSFYILTSSVGLVAQLCPALATSWTKPNRLLCPWDFPGKNIGVGCHFFLQGIFLTQGRNLHLLHLQAGFLPLSHQQNPINKYIDVVLGVKMWLVWFNNAWTCCASKWIHVFNKFWKILNLLKYFLICITIFLVFSFLF